MSRSNKKGLYVENSLMKKVIFMNKQDKKKSIKTWSRKSAIFPEFVGLTFDVYNGRKFEPVFVTSDMVGHKLGEFVPTRVFKEHSSNNKAADSKAAAATSVVDTK